MKIAATINGEKRMSDETKQSARELLRDARVALYDEMHGVHNGSFMDGLESRNRKDTLIATIDAYLATPSESEMEMARQAVDTMGRKMLALGKEIDTSYGPMQPPEIQKDKAIPYLATLIEDYGRRVPRKMLKELWASAYAEGYVQPIKSNRDGEIARIAAKYNVTIEED